MTNSQAQWSTDMILFDGSNVDAEMDSEFYELRRQAIAFLFAVFGVLSPEKSSWPR